MNKSQNQFAKGKKGLYKRVYMIRVNLYKSSKIGKLYQKEMRAVFALGVVGTEIA